MKTISITVTPAILTKAITHSRQCCLVALLLREATGHRNYGQGTADFSRRGMPVWREPDSLPPCIASV
mgnify:CR=1 FL=1